MKNILLIILSVFLTSCSKYFVEEKHGVKINGLSINYNDLIVGFGGLFLGISLMLLFLYFESKFEDSNAVILKYAKNLSLIFGITSILIGGIFLLPLIALIEYLAWYIFGGILVIGFLITIFKK